MTIRHKMKAASGKGECMDSDKRDKTIKLVQAGTVAVYVLLVLRSTVGEYIKLTKKNMQKEAKRKDKLNKKRYAQKKKRLMEHSKNRHGK